MSDQVKLTVRMPDTLHDRLRRRAQDSQRSLNREINDLLWNALAQPPIESERGAVERVLAGSGLWTPLQPISGGDDRSIDQMDHREIRERLDGSAPLSETVMDERGPR